MTCKWTNDEMKLTAVGLEALINLLPGMSMKLDHEKREIVISYGGAHPVVSISNHAAARGFSAGFSMAVRASREGVKS